LEAAIAVHRQMTDSLQLVVWMLFRPEMQIPWFDERRVPTYGLSIDGNEVEMG
jgi:hypothetical protein